MLFLRRFLRSTAGRRSFLAPVQNVPENLGCCRQVFVLVHNAVLGCVRQPCRCLPFLQSVSTYSLPLLCSSSGCSRDVHSAVDPLESCNASHPSDLQEVYSIATLKVSENSHTGNISACIDGKDTREHQSIPVAMNNFCATDEALPSQQNYDRESDTVSLSPKSVTKNLAVTGIFSLQNSMPKAVKGDCLALDDLRVVKRIEKTEDPEHDAEPTAESNDGDENVDSMLHLDDASRLPLRGEASQDVKIIQDICNLLGKNGWDSSTEAFMHKHYLLHLSHSMVANVILKLRLLALVKPFFEWACRQIGLDVYSCHALLLKLGENRHFDEMWDLLHRMRGNNCQIDETTLCIMIKAYGAASMPDMAVDVIRRSNDYGVTAGINVFTTLLAVFFRLRLLSDARLCYRKLLVDNLKLDTCSFSTLIRGFGMMGCSRDAQACFDEMLREGFEPDLAAFNGLIEGFCCANAMQKALSVFAGLQKKGLEPSVFSFNMLIKALCRVGRLKDAFKLYQSMENVCQPNQATFNILLQGMLANAEASKAISFFQSMENEGWVDARSYVFLSNGLRAIKQTEEMLELLWRLFEVHGFANIEVCNTLIYNLSHLGQLDKAEKLFKEMATALERPSVPTYAIMISSYCRAEKLEEALTLLIELKERGYKPSAYCYIPIISLMLKRDRVVDALMWVEEMLKLGLEVTPVTYNILLKKLCMQGMVDQAVKICDISVDKGFDISVESLFGLMKCLCKLHGVEIANARFRSLHKQQVLPKSKAVLQALAVMDTMMPICNEK